MKIINNRSVEGNLCARCRYHSYRRSADGREQNECVWDSTNRARPLLGPIVECTEFFDKQHRHVNDMVNIAWTMDDLKSGRSGFRPPGGSQ